MHAKGEQLRPPAAEQVPDGRRAGDTGRSPAGVGGSIWNAVLRAIGVGPSGAGETVLLGLLLVAGLLLWAEPVVRQLTDHLNSQDYPLWWTAGQRVLRGAPLYAMDGGELDFLYTPFAAILLAIPCFFGKTILVIALSTTALASWWLSIFFANRLAAASGPVPSWAVAAPVAATIPFVYDQFHMGQPNLLLLALVLSGFCCLRSGRRWLAGLPFAAAAAIKVFPLLVLPYLLWRREWRTAAGMTMALLVFLVLLPGGVRGFERNWQELGFWTHAMLLSGSDASFAQRDNHWSYKNQSLYGVESRLLRAIDATRQDDPTAPSLRVNLLDLGKGEADAAYIATAVAIGLGLIAVLPERSRRTPRSDAAEWSIVLLLIVIASPVAYSYYFVWLLPAFTVLVRGLAAETDPRVGRAIQVVLAAAVLLLAVGINAISPPYPQAVGNFLWATIVLLLGLVAQMRRASVPMPFLRPAHGNP
jgi:hypothetical protein